MKLLTSEMCVILEASAFQTTASAWNNLEPPCRLPAATRRAFFRVWPARSRGCSTFQRAQVNNTPQQYLLHFSDKRAQLAHDPTMPVQQMTSMRSQSLAGAPVAPVKAGRAGVSRRGLAVSVRAEKVRKRSQPTDARLAS